MAGTARVHPWEYVRVMSDDVVHSLVLDLLEWVGPGPRPYADVLEVWRTSCPRLAVWEEATSRGFVATRHARGTGLVVVVTPAGAAHLAAHRRVAMPS